MTRPSAQIVRPGGIPREVIREASTRHPPHRARTLGSPSEVRTLPVELGPVTPPSRGLREVLGMLAPVPRPRPGAA